MKDLYNRLSMLKTLLNSHCYTPNSEGKIINNIYDQNSNEQIETLENIFKDFK